MSLSTPPSVAPVMREPLLAPAGFPAPDQARPTVCIVDDDAPLLRALQRLVGAAGFRTDGFPSAEAFLAADRRSNYGCLVLDVHLGGLSGFELHEHLVAGGRAVPVIFITAHDDPAARERARAAGAVAYLRKPFDDHLLIEAIRRVM